jgi:hypothetical protein
MTEAAPVMVINDIPYIERKPHAPSARSEAGACMQCAFFKDRVGCYMALENKATEAFGGDCVVRDVVYVHQEQRA